MPLVKSARIALLLFILIISQKAFSEEFPVPDFFNLSVVAEDMSYSGVAMSVTRFSSARGVSDIEEFYISSWPETRVSKFDRLFVISYLNEEDGILYAVQVDGEWQDRSRVEGFLSVSDLPRRVSDDNSSMPELGLDFPLHASAKVVNDMSFNDGMRKSRFLYITHRANAKTIFDHYQRALLRRDWIELGSQFSPSEHFGVLRFQREERRLDLTIKFMDSKTQMTAVELN